MYTVGETLVHTAAQPRVGHDHMSCKVSFRRLVGRSSAEVMTCDGSRTIDLADLSRPTSL
jgi:hypothetical protein